MNTPAIRDCLGRERVPDRVWPDGSYNCPFCWAAAPAAGCPNPACFARVNPPFPAEVARAALEREAQRAKDAEQRAELERWRREYAAERAREETQRRSEIAAEAARLGACVRCALKDAPYRAPKFIRHRKACPLERP